MKSHDPYSLDDMIEGSNSKRVYMIKEDINFSHDLSIVMMFSTKLMRHWPIIVECWDHKRYGRVKRVYLSKFTEKERKAIGRYHTLIYEWYLRTGFPDYVGMKVSTFNLINRAVQFFAEN